MRYEAAVGSGNGYGRFLPCAIDTGIGYRRTENGRDSRRLIVAKEKDANAPNIINYWIISFCKIREFGRCFLLVIPLAAGCSLWGNAVFHALEWAGAWTTTMA